MSGLFSKEEMEGICGGFFQSSPLSIMLPFDNDSNVKKQLCCNYLKEGPNSPSVNSFIDPLKFPTKFDILAKMAEIVSLSLLSPSHLAQLSLLEVLCTCTTSSSQLFALAWPWVFCMCATLISSLWLFALAQPLLFGFHTCAASSHGSLLPVYPSLFSKDYVLGLTFITHPCSFFDQIFVLSGY